MPAKKRNPALAQLEQLGKSQRWLAAQLKARGVPCSFSHVSEVLRDAKRGSFALAAALHDVLGVDPIALQLWWERACPNGTHAAKRRAA